MAHEHFLLDSSALLTLLEDEAGADRVEELLRSQPVLLPWTGVLEVLYVSRQEAGELEAMRRYALMSQLPAEILWEVDEALVLKAAALKATHRVSLADALVGAYAALADAVLVHKDPELEALAEDVRLEPLPYKGRAAGDRKEPR